jgi:hypothetical protein
MRARGESAFKNLFYLLPYAGMSLFRFYGYNLSRDNYRDTP